MKRNTWTKIHLIISSFFFPFMILIPLTGALYIYGFKGEKVKEVIVESQTIINPKSETLESEVKTFLRENNVDYKFEYIKKRDTYLELRPANKIHYFVYFSDEGTKLTKITPSITAAAIEIHKGHGPKLVKQLSGLFGIGLLLVSLSGFVLAITLKPYRKTFLLSSGVGILTLLILLL